MYRVDQKNATLGIGWGYHSKKICNNPKFDMLSSFLEFDFNIFNKKLFKIATFYLKIASFKVILFCLLLLVKIYNNN